MNTRIAATAMSFLGLPYLLCAQNIQTISWTELGQRTSRCKVEVSLKSGEIIQGKVVRWDDRNGKVCECWLGPMGRLRRDRRLRALSPFHGLRRLRCARLWHSNSNQFFGQPSRQHCKAAQS